MCDKTVIKIWFVQLRSICVVLLTLALAACTTFEYHETKNVPISRADQSQEGLTKEDELLDIGIVVFDAGVDILDDESAAYSSVRQSEAVWFATQLKTTLERSEAWGLVRTVPSANSVIDLVVSGKLLESNGEIVSLLVEATDASGKQWFSKEYFQRASAYSYNPEVNLPDDPFQAMFNQIANDMFDYQKSLSSSQRLSIRSISKVRFARDFVPEAFNEYISTNENGQYQLLRQPADSDPMIKRVERIRARNDLFVDVVQDYYRAFNNNMVEPYKEWRKLSYKEVIYERQLKEQARREKIAGVAIIAGGLAAATSSKGRTTRTAGHIGIFSGARVFANAYSKQNDATLHSETLRELGASLEAELEPSIVDLQDRSITLSGTVDDQMKEWRRILSRMFLLDSGATDAQGSDLDAAATFNPTAAAASTATVVVDKSDLSTQVVEQE